MDFKVGDQVKLRADVAGKWAGVTFTIKKFLPKNVDLEVPGSVRGLRAPRHFLVAADDVAANAAAEVRSLAMTWEPPLVIGTLVRFKDELHVVMAQNRNERYRIVKLGGDGGRYYTNVLRSQMEVVDPATLTASV